MVAPLASFAIAGIPKPELLHWKLCLLSEETAVLSPYLVIPVTVTGTAGVSHTACALTTTGCCPSPVRHLLRITWHPPSVWTVKPQTGVITLVLYKLFTVRRDSGQTHQLRQTCSCVMNVTYVTTSVFKSIHNSSALTVVTDNCHANTLFVSHVTVRCEWCQTSLAIWINHVVSADAADVRFDISAGYWDSTTVQSISNVATFTLAWIGSKFIDTCGKCMTAVCLTSTFIKI